MKDNLILIAYLISSILFILSIKKLGTVKTARQGNLLSSIGMLIAIVATLMKLESFDPRFIIIGLVIGTIIGASFALKVAMTAMPEMVAIFNGFGGGASALVAIAEFFRNGTTFGITDLTIIMLATLIGSITLTGSFIAFGKLQGFIQGKPITYFGQNLLNGLILISAVATSYLTIAYPADQTYFYIVIMIGLLQIMQISDG